MRNKNDIRRYVGEFLAITVIGLIISFLFCPDCFLDWDESPGKWKQIIVSMGYAYSLGYTCSFLMPRLIKNAFRKSRLTVRFVLTLLIMAGVTFVVAAATFYTLVHLLWDNPEWLTWSVLAQTAQITMYIALGVSLFFTSIEFLKNYKREAVRAEKLEKEKINAQFESLKSQVNPHFLFNSLNALSSLIYDNQELAVKYVRQLSDVYRYVLDSRHKDLATLQEELDFIQSYLFLQKIRFGDNLKVDFELTDPDRKLIAPLTLQVLIENAVKHNEVSSELPLTIRIFEQNGHFVVENPMQPKTILDKGAGVGLKNIDERYRLFTDRKITIEQTSDCFRVQVPVLIKENEYSYR